MSELAQVSKNYTLTAIKGIQVGHMHDEEALTGCTVVLCPPQTVGGIDQRGGAPGTHETDLLRPSRRVEHVNAIVLTGGSAYGLATVTGVMRFLEERGIGHDVGLGVVPIVPAAVIFDLGLGSFQTRPDQQMGYAAADNASTTPVREGNIGAGIGASIGKLAGMEFACKAGIGTYALHLQDGLIIAALAVVNALGDVLSETGQILGGTRTPPHGKTFADSLKVLQTHISTPTAGTNTTLAIVATNATLTKQATNKVAELAQNGLARAIRPVHTLFDGDTVFALATGELGAVDVNIVGSFAAEVLATAIRRAVLAAEPLGGLPSATDI